ALPVGHPDGVVADGAGLRRAAPPARPGGGVPADPRVLGRPAGSAARVHRPRAGRRRGAGGLMTLSPVRSVPLTDDEVVALYRRPIGSGRAALGAMLGAIVEVRSEGPWVWAADGHRYLDFGGYGVFILGHRHPAVVAAVHRQLDAHPLATRVFLEPVVAQAAAALAGTLP